MSVLAKLPAHRPSAAVKAAYERRVLAFCDRLVELRSSLDFEVGSRGWAYILEGERAIDKDEIDAAQKLDQRLPQEPATCRSISAAKTASAPPRTRRH